jgi:hypothetical protein
MNTFPDAVETKPRSVAIGAVTIVALVAACGTGVAAFSGLLPASDGVAAAVTTTPIIDVQAGLWQNESNARIRLPSDDGESGNSME